MPWALLGQAVLNPNPGDRDLTVPRHPEADEQGGREQLLGLAHVGAGRKMVFVRVQL